VEDGVHPIIDNRPDHLPLRISQALYSKMVPSDGFHLFTIALDWLRAIVHAICNEEVFFVNLLTHRCYIATLRRGESYQKIGFRRIAKTP
jgi:hypothetical protein